MDEPEVIPYVPDISLPKAVIAGIDGTVALRGDQDSCERRTKKDIRLLWSTFSARKTSVISRRIP